MTSVRIERLANKQKPVLLSHSEGQISPESDLALSERLRWSKILSFINEYWPLFIWHLVLQSDSLNWSHFFIIYFIYSLHKVTKVDHTEGWLHNLFSFRAQIFLAKNSIKNVNMIFTWSYLGKFYISIWWAAFHISEHTVG